MSAPFTFRRKGRDRRTMLAVLGVWAALALAYVGLDMAWWIALFLAGFTLPALRDLLSNPLSGLDLGSAHLAWFSGRRHGRAALDEIEHVRLDTRLDLSVRATLILRDGTKLRLPFEATPPHAAFERALSARGLPVKRFHFQLFQ